MSAPVLSGPDNTGLMLFDCPGCGYCHGVWTDVPNKSTGATWQWNGDRVRPTITPSILAKGEHTCHSYVTDGMIQYLGDSTHALAGQTIPLPPFR